MNKFTKFLKMAPEILRNENILYSNKVDIFSLGIFIYEMLFGVVPYKLECENIKQLLKLVNFQAK